MSDHDSFEPKGNQPNVIEATGEAHKVEAVAGSGKTTTMVRRLENAIRTRETPPNRLLVLTFATEAAHTIQEKLRETLGPREAFEIDVYTYHSFSYRVLKEYAYYIGVSPEFELVTEEDRPQLIESVYDAVDFSFVAPGVPSEGGVSGRTLSELTSFIEYMRREAVAPDEIRAYLPSDAEIRELLSLVDSLREMGEDLADPDAADWDERTLAEKCDQLATVYNAKSQGFDGSSRFQTVMNAHLNAMAETAVALADHLRSVTDPDQEDLLLAKAIFADDHGALGSVAQTPLGRLENYAHMLRRARAFVGSYEAYLERLEDRGAFDYDELIHRTVTLLRDEEIRDDILAEWDAVYCDEFQDTDESQLRLVEELRDGLDIMVVGDSDQAIHEWRGQDPENMSNLPDSFEELGLEMNFRSRQPILDLATNLDPETGEIEAYRDPAPPNVFKVNSEEVRTAEQVSTSISHLLTGRFEDIPARDLSDIAVLVRRNANVREIATQLDRDSIPYTLSNDTTNDLSQGVRTVLSYFRILVSPGDDVSWQRVLLHLYRVPESDIDTLLTAGETIPEGYATVRDSELAAPDRVADAITDYETLRDVATTHSISELYRYFKQETRVEWYLRDADRDALHNIEQLISSFSDSPVQSGLSAEFVTYLERQAHLLSTDDGTATSTGSQSEDAVDIMTIHQAKGLDFDTVLVPYLTEEEFGQITLGNYQRDLYRYDVLIDEVQDEPTDPLRGDRSVEQIAEEWRILHVALTRAKDHLFLFGNGVSSDDHSAALLDSQLPDAASETPIAWSSEGPRMRVWNALMESYEAIEDEDPDAVRDYTDVVNRGVDEDPGKITYYQDELTTGEALETLLEFADGVVAGTLADGETAPSQFADVPLGQQLRLELARQHSHTSLESVRNCERKHVLDHVVGAFPDPGTETGDALTRADVGTVFHDVAEIAYWRGYDTVAEWKDACRWLARSNDCPRAVEPVLECIDRYFETEAAAWPSVGAEVPIELDDLTVIDGEVTGYVDSVRDHPDGGLVVLDYKTSRSRKSIDESHQLHLYVRACQERFDEPVTHAGYVYVGEAGPDTQLFKAAELETMWGSLIEDLQAAEQSAFENYSPGPHCEYCHHRSLGCAETEFAYDDDHRVR